MTANLQVKCGVKIKEIKEGKELIKEKEFRKEIKEKDTKELIKEKEFRKEIKEKDTKEFKDGKEIKEKDFEKGTDAKLTDGRPGGLGLGQGSEATQLEARVSALEAALGLSSQAGQSEPFIGSELRPDLSQSAFAAEEDVTQLQQQMGMGSAHAKRVFDSKTGG